MLEQRYYEIYSQLLPNRWYYVKVIYSPNWVALWLQLDKDRHMWHGGNSPVATPTIDDIVMVGPMIPTIEELMLYNQNKALFNALVS